MSLEELLKQGKLAYSEKRYDDAVRLFSEAQALAKPNPQMLLMTLDLRCQAYVKSGKRGFALRDAKNMIHVSERKKADGYLRCAQIERSRENYADAIKWLEHGARNVSHQRSTFENLITKTQTLMQQCQTNRKRQDPMAAVPLEVVQQILSFLDHREVVCLLRVSRPWKQLVSSLRPLLTTVDFTGAKKPISPQPCRIAFRRLCNRPQTIKLAPLAVSAISFVEAWLTKPSHLENLSVLHLAGANVRVDTRWLKWLFKLESLRIGPGQELSFTAFLQLIERCQNIKDASFEGKVRASLPSFNGCSHENLQHLLIRDDSKSNMPPTLDFSIYPNLRSLELSQVEIPTNRLDLGKHGSLLKLHLTLIKAPNLVLRLPKSLEELGIVEELKRPPQPIQYDQSSKLPNLHTLTLTHWTIVTTLNSLCDTDLPSIKIVTLRHLPRISITDLNRCAKRIFETATSVCFMSEQLRDQDANEFTKLFPVVESLALETAPRISGVFLSDLASKPGCRLRDVTLTDCSNVSTDISSWLKSRGIKCRRLSNVVDAKSGRKVRGDW